MNTRARTALLLVIAVMVLLSKAPPAAALVYPNCPNPCTTRVSNLQAYNSGGVVTITGTLQFRNVNGTFKPLTDSKVTFCWWSTSLPATMPYCKPIVGTSGDVFSDSSSGQFYTSWVSALEPGQYYVNATYAGETWPSGDVYLPSTASTQLLVQLQLSLTLDNPTINVAQGSSKAVTVSVSATNSVNAHSSGRSPCTCI